MWPLVILAVLLVAATACAFYYWHHDQKHAKTQEDVERELEIVKGEILAEDKTPREVAKEWDRWHRK